MLATVSGCSRCSPTGSSACRIPRVSIHVSTAVSSEIGASISADPEAGADDRAPSPFLSRSPGGGPRGDGRALGLGLARGVSVLPSLALGCRDFLAAASARFQVSEVHVVGREGGVSVGLLPGALF